MTDALLKGIAISLLLIFSVGPVIFTILKQSINNGKAGGFSFVGGVLISDIVWVVVSNLFSAIVTQVQQYKIPIGIAGSLILMCMGSYYLFFKKIGLKENAAVIKITNATHAKLMVSGFLLNTVNPGVMAFWLTTATTLATTNTVQQRIIIFSTVLIINSCTDVLKVLLAGKIRTKLNHKNISLINKISGLILLLFGLVLLAGLFYTTVTK